MFNIFDLLNNKSKVLLKMLLTVSKHIIILFLRNKLK